MRRRLTIAAALVVVLLLGALAWEIADLPPLRLVLEYGYPSPMAPTGRTETIEGVEFVEISPGYFRMGSHYGCDEGDLLGRISATVGLSWGSPPKHETECPIHWVEFDSGFWIARTEVTNEQYERFDPKHERGGPAVGDRGPVVDVSWEDAKRYCAWLGEKAGRPVRLPSEAEWECACEAGGADEPSAADDGTRRTAYRDNCLSGPYEVATGPPNRWSLFDLDDNVAELCEDAWLDSYVGAPTDGSPRVDEDSIGYVYRSGYPTRPRPSADRYYSFPAERYPDLGFRPAFSLPAED